MLPDDGLQRELAWRTMRRMPLEGGDGSSLGARSVGRVGGAAEERDHLHGPGRSVSPGAGSRCGPCAGCRVRPLGPDAAEAGTERRPSRCSELGRRGRLARRHPARGRGQGRAVVAARGGDGVGRRRAVAYGHGSPARPRTRCAERRRCTRRLGHAARLPVAAVRHLPVGVRPRRCGWRRRAGGRGWDRGRRSGRLGGRRRWCGGRGGCRVRRGVRSVRPRSSAGRR